MNQINIWAYTTREIKDLKPEFEVKFDVSLTRDYENVWEWIWNGPDAKQRITISREHNFQTGKHDKPLRVTLTWESGEVVKANVVKLTQSILKTDLFIGDIMRDGRDEEDYVVADTIAYES